MLEVLITGRPGLEKNPVNKVIILNKGGVILKIIPPRGGQMIANDADIMSKRRSI